MMTEIQRLLSCYYPLTPGEDACLVGGVPWHYGTEYINIMYRTDPDAIAAYLPEPLAPGPEPDLAYVAFSKWWSVWEPQLDMPFVNPERTQYREAAIWIGCSFQGTPGQMCVHIWVDNDFSLARGWVMGFPKRLGQIYLSEYHPINPAMEAIGLGSKLKGQVSGHGEQLIEGCLEIERESSLEELPELMRRPLFHVRYFPSIVRGASPSVLELVRLGAENVQYGERFWSGKGSLEFYPSDIEAHGNLMPEQVMGAYHFLSGYTFLGGEVLHRWT